MNRNPQPIYVSSRRLLIAAFLAGAVLAAEFAAAGPAGLSTPKSATDQRNDRRNGSTPARRATENDAERRFDLAVAGAPAAQVFSALVSGTPYAIELGPEVSGTITVNLRNVTLREALEALDRLYGFEFRIDGNRILVQRSPQLIRDCDECPEMVALPSGRFTMGSPAGESGRADDEGPQRVVSIGAFALARTEVTQRQWRAIMGSTPSAFEGCDDCPVERVSWRDAREYTRKLTAKTGKTYRLPSEAEWEYACRAGGAHRYCGSDDIDSVAWYRGNSDSRTTMVAGKAPNAWGLYDMSGSAFEWVEDCYHVSYAGAPPDGTPWTSACAEDWRILRGGSWLAMSQDLRAAVRIRFAAGDMTFDFGFRPARTLP